VATKLEKYESKLKQCVYVTYKAQNMPSSTWYSAFKVKEVCKAVNKGVVAGYKQLSYDGLYACC